MTTPTLGGFQEVEPKTVWKNEERDFTPWVAQNIAQISHVIGISLVLEQTEKRVGAYELDIFARVEGTEQRVIIENQLDGTDHKHLGQLIAYASGLDAAIVIWIATRVTDEHKEAVEWLNRIAKDEVSFFLLRPEVLKIDDSRPAVRFHLVVGPSEFSRTIKEAVDDSGAPRHSFRRAFWSALFEHLAANGHSWASGRRTTKDSWITSSIGRSDVSVNVSMAKGSRMRVEIYVSRDEGKRVFDTLFAKRTVIEQKFPDESLSWERLDDGMASRVAVYRDYEKESVEQDSPERTALFQWIAKNLSRFREVAKQHLVDAQ